MKAIVWTLRGLFVAALGVALFGGMIGSEWQRFGIVAAVVLLVVLLVVRWVDLARRKQSPAYL
ncbi:MAG: hypothetical protein C4340_01060 [Armatimonadota bacterium]